MIHFSLSDKAKLKIFLSFIVGFLAVFPHIFAYLVMPDGYYFSGYNFPLNPEDVRGVYFATIRNFAGGDWLYKNPFDPGTVGFFHYPVYLIIGKISGFLHLSNWVAYLGAIYILSVPFCYLVLSFLERIFKDFRKITLCLGLIIFVGLYAAIPEIAGIYTLEFPHTIVAHGGILLVFYNLYFLEKNRFYSRLATIIFAFFLINLSHPWMAIPTSAFCFTWSLIQYFKKQAWTNTLLVTITATLITIPFLVYFSSPERIFWVNFDLELNFAYFVIFFGPILLFSTYGIFFTGKKNLFFAVWILTQLSFVFLPFPFRRRFLEVLYFPLAIMAVFGVENVIDRFKLSAKKNLIYTTVFIASCAGTIFIYLNSIVSLPNDYVYRKLEEREAFLYLEETVKPGQTILALSETGNYMVGKIDVEVYVGHNAQTPDYKNKFQLVNNFYTDRSNPDWEKILFAENICYVYVGPEEKALGADINSGYLTGVFRNKEVEIFKTNWCR